MGETSVGAIARGASGALKGRLEPLLPVFVEGNAHIERAARLAHLQSCRLLLQGVQEDLLELAVNEQFSAQSFTGRDPELINAISYFRRAQSACQRNEEAAIAFENDNAPAKQWRAAVGRARPLIEEALNRLVHIDDQKIDQSTPAFVNAAIAEVSAAGWSGNHNGAAITMITERFRDPQNGYVAAYESFLAAELKKPKSPLREIWTALDLAELKQDARFTVQALNDLSNKLDTHHEENLSEHEETRRENKANKDEILAAINSLIDQGQQAAYEAGKAPPTLDPTSKEALIKTLEGLLHAGQGARKRAGEKMVATPPDPDGAVAELKQLAAQQEDAVADAAQTYRDIGAIAFLSNTHEALTAWKRVTELAPNDAAAHIQLGHLYRRIGELETARAAFQRVLDLGNQLGDDVYLAVAYGNLGILEKVRGNVDTAEGYYKRSLDIEEALGRQEGMAAQYGNLGGVEQTRGNLDAAEVYYKRSLDIDEALGRREGMAINYGNLGILEKKRGNLDTAEGYYKRSLELNKALGRKEGMAINYGNLGNLEEARGNLDAAEGHYKHALDLNEALGRKGGMAADYGNLGNLAAMRGNLDAAEGYYKHALDLNEALGRKEGMADNYRDLGILEYKRGNNEAAIVYWRQSLALYQQIGMPHMVAKISAWLRDIEGGSAEGEDAGNDPGAGAPEAGG